MKIALVNPGKFDSFQPPLSLAYLASYLRKCDEEKHEIKIIDENAGDNIEKEIERFSPSVVGITANTHQISRTMEIVNFINEQIKIPAIVGGVHLSALPERTIKESKADVGVIGEGEVTFFELIQLLKKGKFEHSALKKVKGIIFRNNGEIAITEPRPLIENIDTIPFPARDLLNMDHYVNCKTLIGGEEKRVVHMMTARGCPYNCVFCCRLGGVRRKVRIHSSEYIIKEIDESIKKFNINGISFFDDIFTIDKERVKKICQFLIDNGYNKKITWAVQMRANLISQNDLEFLKLMRKAGCTEVGFGFESGSPRMLSFLKKNTVTVEQNHQAIELCNMADLKIFANFMIGTYGETVEDIQMTKKFIFDHIKNITNLAIHLTTPYPDSDLWDIYEKKGLLKDLKWDDYLMDSFTSFKKPLCFPTDGLSKNDLLNIHRELISLGIKRYPLNVKIKKVLRNPIKFLVLVRPYMSVKIKSLIGERT